MPGIIATSVGSVADAIAAEFRVRAIEGDADLYVRRGVPVPDQFLFDYVSANPGVVDEVIVVDPSSFPEALRPGRWFAGIQAIGPAPVVYEVSVRFTRPFIDEIFDRTPVTRTNLGVASRSYLFRAGPEATSIEFALYYNIREADMVVARDVLPAGAAITYSNPRPGTNAEIVVVTNRLVSLPGNWFITVNTAETNDTSYTLRAIINTNITVLPTTGVELVSQFTLQPGLTNVLLEWRSVAGRTYRAQSTTNAFATPVVWVD